MSTTAARTGERDDERDASWAEEDDWTEEALRLLRDLRSPHRRKRAGQIGFTVYCVLLILVVWGVLPGFSLFIKSSMGADYTVHGAAILAALPSGVCALVLGSLLIVARDALWRGPVVPPRDSADWLLTQPVRIARILLPWFWLSCGASLAVGLLASMIGMVTLGLTVKTGLAAAFAWCAVGGVCVPLLATALGVAVEAYESIARWVRAATPYVSVLVLALAAQSALAAAGHRVPWLERIELRSGPWGWIGIAALSPTPAAVPGGPIAAVLALAAAAAGIVLARRAAGSLPLATVRQRSRTTTGVMAALLTVELRTARQVAAGASGTPRPARLTLPAPRRAALAVPWRDLLALLHSPGRLGRALVLTVLSVLGAVVAAGAHRVGGLAATAAALVFGYWAVAQLLEPARLETDDTRRGSWSPYPYGGLMLRHTIVPVALGLLVSLLAAACVALLGGGVRVALAPAVVPAFVAAGLVNACRGVSKQHLLLSPAQSPTGSVGPVLFLAWYLSGPLVAVAALTVPFVMALHTPTAAHLALTACVSAVVTAGLLRWAYARAGKLLA
ncbi:hypothetical protein QMK19_19315 [Streptomyces sp. H10-C2]|uniref:hypothetical protein n=1 Tax=unclassified Streptomyces TaxID=2593676 RepID=UPI0024BA8274|nr:MULTISPECIES: hypothetical protein [unclassified Streptomyces]MDJ0343420.1 hypothetical protein [Streptomyces sp. PH10-H1]MDJ0371769.1 hypothetical protein [Streptomyces sp. H10-C2]